MENSVHFLVDPNASIFVYRPQYYEGPLAIDGRLEDNFKVSIDLTDEDYTTEKIQEAI